jgi:hypothetical protein
VTLHPIEEPTSIRAVYQRREIPLKPDDAHTSVTNKDWKPDDPASVRNKDWKPDVAPSVREE